MRAEAAPVSEESGFPHAQRMAQAIDSARLGLRPGLACCWNGPTLRGRLGRDSPGPPDRRDRLDDSRRHDDEEPEPLEVDIALKQAMGPDHDVDLAGFDAFDRPGLRLVVDKS